MIVAWLGFRFRPNPNLQDSRYIIVAGDMNDYDARLADSFGHTPKSMALELMTQPEGEASRLISVGQHVKSADRFTDWCGCQICLLLPNTSALSVHRYDIDGDCVDDGGKEHSAIGTSFGRMHPCHLWWLMAFLSVLFLTRANRPCAHIKRTQQSGISSCVSA
jgi:hypothetical protein